MHVIEVLAGYRSGRVIAYRNPARLPGNRRSLVNRHIPLPRLFFNGWGFLVRQWRIEDLANSAFGNGS